MTEWDVFVWVTEIETWQEQMDYLREASRLPGTNACSLLTEFNGHDPGWMEAHRDG